MTMPFNPPNSLTPAQSAANQVVMLISQTFNTRVRNFRQAYATVWNNPAVTAMEVVAAMGNQAVRIFTASATEATLLNSYQPSLNLPTTIPAGYTFTGEVDGTATLTKV